MSAIDTTVIVVNWNSAKDLTACLASLRRQTERDFETIVVDNGSSDDSIERVRREHPEVRVLENGANLGFAEACNRGIACSDRSWVALLNNDAVADPRWIEELRSAARASDEDVGMIQARIMDALAPARVDSTGVELRPGGRFHDRESGTTWTGRDGLEEIFCTSAGAALYRRAMLDAVRLPTGVFDRDFGLYFEDVDLGWRCRLAGWSARLAPRAVVYHARHSSSRRRGDRFVELQCRRNRIATLLKNASLALLTRSLAGTLRDLVLIFVRSGPGGVRGHFHSIGHALSQRSRVTALIRVSRRDVERHWRMLS
ncbi:glycosyltransferase family 2 protein [Myxococcota bacterium]|nr:glycosyltransferase family 2 protein [Myxococcota bacterium]MCZ7617416.1 glycosyltransferase family 2 protein [Myxococcota bacterium]